MNNACSRVDVILLPNHESLVKERVVRENDWSKTVKNERILFSITNHPFENWGEGVIRNLDKLKNPPQSANLQSLNLKLSGST